MVGKLCTLPGRGGISDIFFWGVAIIRRGQFWYCSLEMKNKFVMGPLATASWWIVGG